MSDRCVVGAACEACSDETLSPDTIIYGSDCRRYTKTTPMQVYTLCPANKGTVLKMCIAKTYYSIPAHAQSTIIIMCKATNNRRMQLLNSNVFFVLKVVGGQTLLIY